MPNPQTRLAAILVLAMALTCATVWWASHSPAVAKFAEKAELQRFKDGGGIFMNRGNFVDFEDRLLLDELPNTDFSRGGVYFFGTSTTKWALTTWDLPDAERPLVHNFGIGASNHRYTTQFIKHLIDHQGLLPKGGDQVHVVIGSFWSMGKEWRGGFFSRLWSRYGLYSHDEDTGITAVNMPMLQRYWVTERARLAGFVTENLRRSVRAVASSAGLRIGADGGRISPADIRRRALENATVSGWETELTAQMEQLRALIKDLHARGVKVTVVHMPTRAVYGEMPLPARYAQDLPALAKSEGAAFVDLSRLLSDDEFVDVNHANYAGLQKLNHALMELARPDIDAIRARPR